MRDPLLQLQMEKISSYQKEIRDSGSSSKELNPSQDVSMAQENWDLANDGAQRMEASLTIQDLENGSRISNNPDAKKYYVLYKQAASTGTLHLKSVYTVTLRSEKLTNLKKT